MEGGRPGRKVIGYMPVYVPREIVHAAGMLPVGILGGGADMEVIHGDAFLPELHLPDPRSTIEMAINGNSTSSTDDVPLHLRRDPEPERHLESSCSRTSTSGTSTRPRTSAKGSAGSSTRTRCGSSATGWRNWAGGEVSDDDIRRSIVVYNENRRWVNKVYELPADFPWKGPVAEVYLLMRAGMVSPRGAHAADAGVPGRRRGANRPMRTTAGWC